MDWKLKTMLSRDVYMKYLVMKKSTLIVIVCLSCLVNSYAQDSTLDPAVKRNNFFYVAPLDLIVNTIQVGYERKLNNHNTIALNVGFKLSKKDEIVNRLGGNGEFQYRVNLRYNKDAQSNMVRDYSTFTYFAPFLQYRYEEITDVFPHTYDVSVSEKKNTYVNSGFGGFGFGIRLMAMENRFCLNVFAGGGMKYSDIIGDKNYSDFTEVGYTGIAPKVSFQLGIAF